MSRFDGPVEDHPGVYDVVLMAINIELASLHQATRKEILEGGRQVVGERIDDGVILHEMLKKAKVGQLPNDERPIGKLYAIHVVGRNLGADVANTGNLPRIIVGIPGLAHNLDEIYKSHNRLLNGLKVTL